ncbi:hypothetical protein Dcar01_02411 [Deinococcus carri]|uniref:Uncharacterized protein n=1 Tax=Deinococcus carri TaxID=1211323 RepID=A0ABP9WBS4_9DEIO
MSGVWEPGTILAAITLGSGLLWQVWDRLGKGRADAFARTEAERDRLDRRVQELEKGREEDRGRLDRVEAELEDLKRERNTLLDFLRDVVSDLYDHDWCKRRAQELLSRLAGEKG